MENDPFLWGSVILSGTSCWFLAMVERIARFNACGISTSSVVQQILPYLHLEITILKKGLGKKKVNIIS